MSQPRMFVHIGVPEDCHRYHRAALALFCIRPDLKAFLVHGQFLDYDNGLECVMEMRTRYQI